MFCFFTVYLPVNASVSEDTIRLFAMVGTGYAIYGNVTNSTVPGLVINYKWNIKIRQIDCKSNDPMEGKGKREREICRMRVTEVYNNKFLTTALIQIWNSCVFSSYPKES